LPISDCKLQIADFRHQEASEGIRGSGARLNLKSAIVNLKFEIGTKRALAR